MPRKSQDEETLVDDEELSEDEDMRDAIESAERGRPFIRESDGKLYHRVPRAIAEAVMSGRRLIPGDSPETIGPKGDSNKQSGAFAGWSTEKRGDRSYRIPVLRLDTKRWTVIDIDNNKADLTRVPGNLAAIVETQRGMQLILQGGVAQNKDLDFLRDLDDKRDANYLRISLKRGTFNLRGTDRAHKGTARNMYIVKKGKSPQEERDLRNLANSFRGAGGRVRKEP